MIFAFFFYTDETAFLALSRDEMNVIVDAHYHYNHEVLEKRATVLATRGLQPSRTAVTVQPGGVTQGPAVTAEMSVNGLYLVECADLDAAVELARAYPMKAGLGRIEIRPVMTDWDYAPSADSPAAAESVWRLYRDPTTWASWQHGVEQATLDGPSVRYRIVEARENAGYTSETELAPDVVLRERHELSPLPGGGTRITHGVTMPRAALDAFGMHFSGDYNAGMRDTLWALSERAVALEGGA
jgi:hypothetical protein